ncbi:MAG: hypothetical protein K6C13_04085 [Oscillospiraceae bacterium]|nr:hypothetical protein [Oscillospiraceae bacterium]
MDIRISRNGLNFEWDDIIVAYTEREGNSIRLISARLAEKEEEEAYYGNIR